MRRILYIDDCPDQLQLVQQLLERELPGVMVEVCCSASGAEAFLNSHCYDVVICDVALPGELGTDIAEKILERDSKQPIYLMSEYTGPSVREGAWRIGLDLHRKFSGRDPFEFVADIRQLLDKRPCDSSSENKSAGRGETAVQDRIVNEAATRQKSIQLISPHVLAARASLA